MVYEFEVIGDIVGKERPRVNTYTNMVYTPNRTKDYEKELDIEDWDYVSKFKTYVIVDIDVFAKKWGKDLIKKTVNIPRWVNTKAEEMKINFSKTLEEALLEKIYK